MNINNWIIQIQSIYFVFQFILICGSITNQKMDNLTNFTYSNGGYELNYNKLNELKNIEKHTPLSVYLYSGLSRNLNQDVLFFELLKKNVKHLFLERDDLPEPDDLVSKVFSLITQLGASKIYSVLSLPCIESLELKFQIKKKETRLHLKKHLSKIKNLKSLVCHHTDIPLDFIPNLPNLAKLSLNGLIITKEFNEIFKDSKLKEISFESCDFQTEWNLNLNGILHILSIKNCKNFSFKKLLERSEKITKIDHLDCDLVHSDSEDLKYYYKLLKEKANSFPLIFICFTDTNFKFL